MQWDAVPTDLLHLFYPFYLSHLVDFLRQFSLILSSGGDFYGTHGRSRVKQLANLEANILNLDVALLGIQTRYLRGLTKLSPEYLQLLIIRRASQRR